MNDIEAGYKVFVRTIAGLVFTLCFLIASTFAVTAAIAGGSIAATFGHGEQLAFWCLTLVSCYSLGAIICGRFLWLLGNRPSIFRLLFVVLIASIILALLSPLIQTVLREATPN